MLLFVVSVDATVHYNAAVNCRDQTYTYDMYLQQVLGPCFSATASLTS
jgi:hypothetical protein